MERQTFGAAGRWSGHPSRFLNDIPAAVLDERYGGSNSGYFNNASNTAELQIERDTEVENGGASFGQRYAANAAINRRSDVEF